MKKITEYSKWKIPEKKMGISPGYFDGNRVKLFLCGTPSIGLFDREHFDGFAIRCKFKTESGFEFAMS